MKKTPWRFYIPLFLLCGMPAGLGLGLGFGRSGWHPLISALVATFFALLCMAVVARYYRLAMLKRDPQFTMADAAPRCDATLTLPVSADDAYDLCMNAVDYLPGFFLEKTSKEKLTIEGLTGGGGAGYWSFGSPGERITIRIKALGLSQAEAFIESKPGTKLVILDFGKNRKNLNVISSRINEAINRRFDQQREAAERAEMQRALTEAKLSALEAHIEPHFLYNTLANAQLLTRLDPKRADEMLGNLITYLRSSLPQTDSNGSINGSTLGREIERSTAYLDILKIRMGTRLNVQVNLPETLAGRAFPAMMVQTLVENAIKHGLEPKPHGGTISIDVAEVNNQLVLTVSDDGLGLREGTSGTGLGLKNIRDRLKLSFNDQASLSLKPNAPSGMVAVISIPSIPSITVNETALLNP